jgi:pyrroline-5-carboxylate reductase
MPNLPAAIGRGITVAVGNRHVSEAQRRLTTELLHRSSDSAATLRRNVTSPGGTTAAALDVLMNNNGIGPLMKTAIAAATRRGKELAG